jgi:hypothetical protein
VGHGAAPLHLWKSGVRVLALGSLGHAPLDTSVGQMIEAAEKLFGGPRGRQTKDVGEKVSQTVTLEQFPTSLFYARF